MMKTTENMMAAHAFDADVMAPGQDEHSAVDNELVASLVDVRAAMAPLWPLGDFVAVNPFVGMSSSDFLAAHQRLRRLAHADILMPLAYFRAMFHQDKVTVTDIACALGECRIAKPSLDSGFQVDDIVAILRKCRREPDEASEAMSTVADEIDRWSGSDWSDIVVNEVSRFCASHFDEGQAIWSSPWQGMPLFQAWREAAAIDRRMELLGASGFRTFVANLPSDPLKAIAKQLSALGIPAEARRDFLLCQLCSVAGWASYLTRRPSQMPMDSLENDDVIGLLAIRLAYDAGLASLRLMPPESLFAEHWRDAVLSEHQPSKGLVVRYVMQNACEIAYRRKLFASLQKNFSARSAKPRTDKAVQMVFCIDVRSEIIRRHLETVSGSIETFGFAGFFGLPIEYVPLGAAEGSAQCPVLLKPSVRVEESLCGCAADVGEKAAHRRSILRLGRNVWMSFQRSASSCFSFVEALGLTYFAKLLSNSFGWTRSSDDGQFDGVPAAVQDKLGPKLTFTDGGDVSPQWVSSAEGILRNLGLTSNFARLVVLCGHGSETANNPYKAGLDCGACGGHTGESNARTAAALFNDPKVREALHQRGIHIPDTTVFVAALHNTTTDEIRFFDADSVPETHRQDLAELQKMAQSASARARQERAGRLHASQPNDLIRRSQDWSEVRPEWGLAGNAAFIVAPRSRTQGVALDGRTFLHSYDYHQDPDGRVLELIMTAPMVVTNWINLQYYASTVDNLAFGSGNKVLHNVVGQLGVFEGNGGDLRTGLPWQSVHDGAAFQHEPLRLLVLIEAPRSAISAILAKHRAVRDLAVNGWLHLVAFEDGRVFRHGHDGLWTEAVAEMPVV